MARPATRTGEFGWIARHFAPLVKDGSFGLLDDAALWTPDAGASVAVTADTIVEGIHFFPDAPAFAVAQRAVRVNASDLAAKGVRPQAMMLSLGVPDRWTDRDMASFAQGLESDQLASDIALLGGDTTRSPERLTVAVTMMGSADPQTYVSRLGARPGDVVAVTGSIGDATLGLVLRLGELSSKRDDEAAADLATGHDTPPMTWRNWPIPGQGASAAMDVSDGLVGDLAKLCTASGVSADIDLARMPVSERAARAFDCSQAATLLKMATGGDDYEILLTAPAGRLDALAEQAGRCGTRLTVIGEIVEQRDGAQEGVRVSHRGVPVEIGQPSYQHG